MLQAVLCFCAQLCSEAEADRQQLAALLAAEQQRAADAAAEAARTASAKVLLLRVLQAAKTRASAFEEKARDYRTQIKVLAQMVHEGRYDFEQLAALLDTNPHLPEVRSG